MATIWTFVLLFSVYESTAFVVDYDNKVCDITMFANCSTSYMNMLTVTNTSTTIDQDVLYSFYCGNNITKMLQCMRNKLNPSCGPGTDNWQVRESIASVDPHMYDKLCRNDSSQIDLLSCQTKLPRVDGYVNCLTGDTLNKTLDPTDTCNFYQQALACSYKYTSLMCPAVLATFKEQIPLIKGCSLQLATAQEALSCDAGMEKACDVAYNPPQLLIGSTIAISPRMRLFLASSFGHAYLQCIDKVDNLCKTNIHSTFSAASFN